MRLQQGFAAGGMGFRGRLHSSNLEPLMSDLGQKQTSAHVCVMSALPPKADIGTQSWNVRFVPKADSCTATKVVCYSIALSAVASSVVISVIFGALAHVRYYPNSDRTADIAQCRRGAKFERRLRATASFTLDALLDDRAAGQ